MPSIPNPLSVIDVVRVLPPKGLNTSVYLDLNDFARQTAWAHGFMHVYALWLGPTLLAVAVVVAYAVAWWRRASHVAVLLLLGVLGTIAALGIAQLVGHATKELRPFIAHPHALVLVPKANDFAFPSDHSILAGGLTVSLLLALGGAAWSHVTRSLRTAPLAESAPLAGSARPAVRRAPVTVTTLAVASIVLGLFLCFARVYVGVHYPGDVVGGYLLAGVVVILVSLLRPIGYRLADRAEPTPAAALVRRPMAHP